MVSRHGAAHPPAVFWICGLPAAGKSTLARTLHRGLAATRSHPVGLLDADLERDGGVLDGLEWSPEDRATTVRALAAAARQYPIAIVTLVTPTAAERELARRLLGARLHLVHLRTPEALCRMRDAHRAVHAYRPDPPACAPELLFTEPVDADLVLDGTLPAQECAAQLAEYARKVLEPGFLPGRPTTAYPRPSGHTVWYSGGPSDDGDRDRGMACARLRRPLVEAYSPRSFALSRDGGVFCVGSCFARTIERRLHRNGFVVPSWTDELGQFAVREGHPQDQLNRFNVESIEQELRWALDSDARYPRSGIVDISAGVSLDLHTHNALRRADRPTTEQQRAITTRVFRRVRDCQVVLLTLGLVEIWRDRLSGMALNRAPARAAWQAEPDRYALETQDVETTSAALRRVLALLRRYGRPGVKVVLTVSPVPMRATFSGHDVLLANTASKSVLRSAVTDVTAQAEDVYYFPSYEMVLHSDPATAWRADRAHVSTAMADFVVEVFLRQFGPERRPVRRAGT